MFSLSELLQNIEKHVGETVTISCELYSDSFKCWLADSIDGPSIMIDHDRLLEDHLADGGGLRGGGRVSFAESVEIRGRLSPPSCDHHRAILRSINVLRVIDDEGVHDLDLESKPPRGTRVVTGYRTKS